ncbi:hypothetical protein ACRE_016120 [Hapsidospora chrysogenum ATCC 11550]|uniref:Uncharacterized protein n=1 Tax=Hapsidospora chrysogenum (strain ATCC 11550 / CBS 779.69 / DSM 880 / IAM 14645 / JCM 23072 / IMI 49137) TaxID=857340 RepID=A0A086TDP3_HAPC1|nr:hypothetical protein ACRE_016120 [Hapsidospora chrysogenum ATCC 11550]
MNVLGHSFSQKCRRSKRRPRDLHIRKVSFSGSSLSGCSLSSSDSTASAMTAIITPTQHTTVSGSGSIPPPRLHERAFKVSHSPQRPQFTTRSSNPGGTFYHDDDDDTEEAVEEDSEEDSGDEDDENLPRFEMQMPPHASRGDEHGGHDRHEPTDYFAFALARRPPMPRSRWSESTIQSVQSIDALPTPGSTISTAASEQDENQGPPVKVEMPPNMNFSYKRAVSTPGATVSNPSATVSGYRRPPMKTMDSIDEFVKRGGWKRRGVVFREDEVETGLDADLCL